MPEIAGLDTAREVLFARLPLLIPAIGQTFVLVIAGIDLSITSKIAMSSVVAASIMTTDGGYLGGTAVAVPPGVAAFLVLGLAVGALNGLCTTLLGMPAFMVTLPRLRSRLPFGPDILDRASASGSAPRPSSCPILTFVEQQSTDVEHVCDLRSVLRPSTPQNAAASLRSKKQEDSVGFGQRLEQRARTTNAAFHQ